MIDAAIADAKMDIPDAMVETEQRQIIEEFSQRMRMQGLTMEQYMQFTGMTPQAMMEQTKPQALKRIQSRLVLEAVAKAENLAADEEEYEAEIKDLAEKYQMETDKIKEMLGEKGKKQVEEDLAIRKAVEFLTANAK